MELATKFRQEEAVRFFQWMASEPGESEIVDDVIFQNAKPKEVIKCLKIIKNKQFYFLMPFLFRVCNMSGALAKAKELVLVEQLERDLRFSSFDDTLENLIQKLCVELED